ncbi:MAG: single-stranded-DNA-specific exonuclease RecJ [Candidatus Daviesbacteria bacterium]|nr:single-stranded-DNA-specific exonuclease RecJ [Candidatus Daviesbacteria bacterium]
MKWQISPSFKNAILSPDDLLNQLLINREIKEEDREEFLNPKLENYSKDLLLAGIKVAVERIKQAISEDEQIIIYGDYDADGVCGTAILYLALAKLKAKVLPYLPHREKEGYGLSEFGLDKALEKGAKLVITVDNGIVALDQAKYAKKIGIDLIITDHHLPREALPEALSIIHSTQMSGSAVAWCLSRELLGEKDSEEFLDLVAVGTICDLISLTNLNRPLVQAGLKVLNRTEKLGFLALMRECALDLGEISSSDVGRILGPRINAVGRLEDSIEALRLLCTKDPVKAISLARHLCESNDLKKKYTLEAITEAKGQVLQSGDLTGKKILLLHSPNWIPGVIGLVAGRIAEEYKVSTIIISEGETISKGSARSVNGLNIVETLRICADLLVDIGGHPQAAGFSLETKKLEEFKKKLDEVMGGILIEEKENGLKVEAILDLSKVDKNWVKTLEKLEPFGQGNPIPIFGSKKVKISDCRTLSNGQHLKFKAEGVDAIAFSKGSLESQVLERGVVDIAYFLEINKFNGSENLQLKVLDININ